jgi:hypothetical protein
MHDEGAYALSDSNAVGNALQRKCGGRRCREKQEYF